MVNENPMASPEKEDMVAVKMPIEMRKRLEYIAYKERRTLSEVVRLICEDWLDRLDRKERRAKRSK